MNGREKVMVLIAYDRAVDEELMEVIVGLDIEYYTKWKDALGVGRHDPHLGDDVWPGLNNVVMTVVDEDMKSRLVGRLRELQARFASVGLRAFVVPVLEMV
jgi:hypothetical protein